MRSPPNWAPWPPSSPRTPTAPGRWPRRSAQPSAATRAGSRVPRPPPGPACTRSWRPARGRWAARSRRPRPPIEPRTPPWPDRCRGDRSAIGRGPTARGGRLGRAAGPPDHGRARGYGRPAAVLAGPARGDRAVGGLGAELVGSGGPERGRCAGRGGGSRLRRPGRGRGGGGRLRAVGGRGRPRRRPRRAGARVVGPHAGRRPGRRGGGATARRAGRSSRGGGRCRAPRPRRPGRVRTRRLRQPADPRPGHGAGAGPRGAVDAVARRGVGVVGGTLLSAAARSDLLVAGRRGGARRRPGLGP